MKSLSTCLLAAVVSLSAAQTRSFEYTVADFRILQSKQVQQELKITEAQRTKMNAAARAHDKRAEDYRKSIAKARVTPEMNKKVEAKMVELVILLKDGVFAALTTGQIKRLSEITLQTYGNTALADPRVAKEVGLSEPQLKKVQKLMADGRKKVQQIEKAAAEPVVAPYRAKKPKDEAEAKAIQLEARTEVAAAIQKVRPQMVAEERKVSAQIGATLTPAQTQKFTSLKGKPFTAKKAG